MITFDANSLATLGAAVVAAGAAVATTIITTRNNRKRAKQDAEEAKLRREAEARAEADRQRNEARAEARARESKLSMDMMFSTMDLAYITSLALSGGHLNGNVEAAQQRAMKSKEKYDKFCREQAADSITI
ncbi:MAG: hypothetical protein EOM14_09315 [Clostridia bacterium]|nr:hypothetical protein [Clostridia bacterium]